MEAVRMGQLYIPCDQLGQKHAWFRFVMQQYPGNMLIYECWQCSTCWKEYRYKAEGDLI